MLTRDDISESVEQRFWTHVAKGGPDECWEWTGARDSSGYGSVKINRTVRSAHRVSFLLAFGFLAQATMHKCDNPPCVNPRHLFGGTQADNARDMANKWRRKGKVTPAVKSTIIALHECGMGYRSIGRQVGLDHGYVGRVLRGERRLGAV